MNRLIIYLTIWLLTGPLHNNDSTGFRSSCLSKQCQKSSDETLHVTGKRKVGLFGCDGL